MKAVVLRLTALLALVWAAGAVVACDAAGVVPEEPKPTAAPNATAVDTTASSSSGTTNAETMTTGAAAGGEAMSGGPQVVSITAKDFAYEAPSSIPSGLTTLHMTNTSQTELHQVALAKLDATQTVSDFVESLMSMASEAPVTATGGTTPTVGAPEAEAPQPTWAAGPQAIAPGDNTSVTTFLEPGNYVMLCFIPGADGIPHFAKGMVAPLVVADNRAAKAELPPADTSIGAGEFAFIDAPPTTAGQHVFRFENKGQQDHEVVLVELDPGKSAMDFVKAFEPGAPPGPPPGRPMGGVTQVSPGVTANFGAELQAGARYAYICFVTDPATSQWHAALGMTREFTVK